MVESKFFGMKIWQRTFFSTQILVLFYVETLFCTRSNRAAKNAKSEHFMALKRIEQLLHGMNNTMLLLFTALTVPWLQQF
jgi:hypothetical protein